MTQIPPQSRPHLTSGIFLSSNVLFHVNHESLSSADRKYAGRAVNLMHVDAQGGCQRSGLTPPSRFGPGTTPLWNFHFRGAPLRWGTPNHFVERPKRLPSLGPVGLHAPRIFADVVDLLGVDLRASNRHSSHSGYRYLRGLSAVPEMPV